MTQRSTPPEPPATGPLGRTVVLVGLMGAGKSVIGRRLAQQIGVPFRDADTEIEAAAGLSVNDIFAKHGEAHFREGERRVIRRLLGEPPHVLATGGGAFMNAETRALIAEKAVSVWLRAELAVLMRRVAKRNTRPLLATGNPEETMRRLMDERYPVYATADITVDTVDGPHDEVVAAIMRALAARGLLDAAKGSFREPAQS
jgi:shikimate kinase